MRETLSLLETKVPARVSMSCIAELSDLSTKMLNKLFGSRSGIQLAAAEQTLTNIPESEAVASAPECLLRIVELTKRTMIIFRATPDLIASEMSVVVGISATEEVENHRIGITQQLSHKYLLTAKAKSELKIGTDCLQLSQLMAASQ
jgi:hypothetical protein